MAIYVRDENGVLQAWEIPAYKGEKGEAGITPNLQIGDVITLESGQQATIVRRGDDENPIFDFAIPKGENGEDGIYVGRIEDAPSHAQIVVNDDASPYDLFFENANVSYMGDTYTSLKEKADADIEYLLRKFGSQHYEGSNITATDTYQKQVKSAILSGKTGYRDKDTGEILETFEEGRNLELVSVRVPVLSIETGINLLNPNLEPEVVSYTDRLHPEYFKVNFGDRLSISTENSVGWWNSLYIYSGNKELIRSKYGDDLRSPRTITLDNPSIKDVAYVRFGYSKFGDISKTMLNRGEQLEFMPYNGDYKINILSTPEDVELGSVGGVKDELDLVIGELTQRTDIRPYKEGDESNSEVLTDMTNTRYKLPKEVIKTVDLNGQKVYSYDGTTHYTTSSLQGHPSPILSIDVPTNTTKMIARQREEIEQQEQKLQEQEEIQNLLIESQLDWFEQTVLLDNNQGIPSHIQKLYEVAYQRGIRFRKEE